MYQRKVKDFLESYALFWFLLWYFLSSFFLSGVRNSGKDKSIGPFPAADERFEEGGKQGRKGSAWTWASEGLESFFRGDSQRHRLLIYANWLRSCSREDDFPHHTENGGYLPFFVSASLSMTQVTNMQRNLMTGNSLFVVIFQLPSTEGCFYGWLLFWRQTEHLGEFKLYFQRQT